jgi:simple sugar transport system substrate-binding protein
MIVHEVTIPVEVQKDLTSSLTQKFVSDSLIKYPNVKFVVTDHGALTASIPSILEKIGKKPGEIIIAGFDLSPNTVTGIKDGYIGLILDQQPYLQGYLPILQACLTKKYEFAGLYINTGTGLIDGSNVDMISSLVEQKIR